MAATYVFFLLMTWTTATLASVLPVHTDDLPQEHHMARYARMMGTGPVMPILLPPTYHSFYNYYGRPPPTHAPPRPKSELFRAPANTGIFSGGWDSTGLSYVNNLLSGVNRKIYGTPTSGFGSSGSIPFRPPTSSANIGLPTSNAGTPIGTSTGTGFGTPGVNTGTGFGTPAGTPTGNIGTDVGTSNPGTGGSPIDIFGPGLRPETLDLPDPTDTGSAGTGNGAPPTGVIINNGPNQPPVSLSTGNPSTPQPQPGSGDPLFPSQNRQSSTWVWPDEVITGSLPFIQLGAASQGGSTGVQGNSKEPVTVDQQPQEQTGGVASFHQRGQQSQEPAPAVHTTTV